MMVREIPVVLTSDFYATASLIGGIAYLFLMESNVPFGLQIAITAVLVTAIRLLAMKFNIRLPIARERFKSIDDMDVSGKPTILR
jgi:uncharacterized membrane protein YeiH